MSERARPHAGLETPERDSRFLQDLDNEDLRSSAEEEEGDEEERETPDPAKVAKELQRVRDSIQRAETLPRDSKADKLLEVMRIIGERPAERRRVVIFTESLVTQDYLQKVLIARGGYAPESITLFRGTNDSARANQALERWQIEVGESLPAYQRPSRAVAVRLALVHEFKGHSQEARPQDRVHEDRGRRSRIPDHEVAFPD